jgi:hypothetical protein
MNKDRKDEIDNNEILKEIFILSYHYSLDPIPSFYGGVVVSVVVVLRIVTFNTLVVILLFPKALNLFPRIIYGRRKFLCIIQMA